MKNETEALNETIIALKEKRAYELVLLKEQLHTTYESLKPINLIKSTFSKVATLSETKSNILGPAIGLGTGYISKKLWMGSSHNPIKRIFGTLIQFAVASVVTKYSDGIKNVGNALLQRFSKHKTKNHKKNFIT
ncbi:MAG TPA: hypothetical protein VLM44_01235 [Lutibacter sp.]|nr:hypothetical protein [Lutibacter sp.]